MAIGAAVIPPRHSALETGAARIDVLVISKDDSLVIELGPLLGERYRVHAVDTVENISEQVNAARWIGILDVDSQTDAYGAVSQLEVQHPGCPLIVLSVRAEEWIDGTGGGSMLAAIRRDQLVTAQLSEALRAAEHRVHRDHVDERAAAGSAPRLERFDVNPVRRGSVWAATALLALLLAANGVWLHHRFAAVVHNGAGSANAATDSTKVSASAGQRPDRGVDAGSMGSAASIPSAMREQSVMELLSAARIALREQKLLLPRLDSALRGDSALELYVQVLKQDPQNDEALDGVRRLLVVGRDRIATDVASGKLDDADSLLAVFKATGTDATDLGQLANEINSARPKWLAQRASQNISAGDFKAADQLIAQATASGADASAIRALRSQEDAKKLEVQLTAMAAQVDAAIRAGSLLQPGIDNARTRLAAMRSISRNHPLTVQAQHEVQVALFQAGEQATRAAQFDAAQRDLNAAAEFGSFAPITEARLQLQGARDAAGRSTAVSTVTLPQVRRAAASVASVPAAEQLRTPRPYIFARPTRVLPVTYPANANVNGSVIVEFTLSAKGSASNVTVVQSDLPSVFDVVATKAVKRGHFSTDELVMGQPTRARIKLRFNIPAK